MWAVPGDRHGDRTRWTINRYRQPAVVFSLVSITTLMLVAVFFLDRSHKYASLDQVGAFSFQPSVAKPRSFVLAWFLHTGGAEGGLDIGSTTLLPVRELDGLLGGLDRTAARSGTAIVFASRLRPACC